MEEVRFVFCETVCTSLSQPTHKTVLNTFFLLSIFYGIVLKL